KWVLGLGILGKVYNTDFGRNEPKPLRDMREIEHKGSYISLGMGAFPKSGHSYFKKSGIEHRVKIKLQMKAGSYQYIVYDHATTNENGWPDCHDCGTDISVVK